jgi:hypothetical protein
MFVALCKACACLDESVSKSPSRKVLGGLLGSGASRGNVDIALKPRSRLMVPSSCFPLIGAVPLW